MLVLSIKYQISSIKYQVSKIKHQVSNIKYQKSNIKYQVSNIKYQVSRIKYQNQSDNSELPNSELGTSPKSVSSSGFPVFNHQKNCDNKN